MEQGAQPAGSRLLQPPTTRCSGRTPCQNCHGDVKTYTVGRVANVDDINLLVDKYPGLIELSKPTLTMGWCIECQQSRN